MVYSSIGLSIRSSQGFTGFLKDLQVFLRFYRISQGLIGFLNKCDSNRDGLHRTILETC